MGYGTGAIMAVPAHDQRDFEFHYARNINCRIPIVPIQPNEFAPLTPENLKESSRAITATFP